MYFVVGGAIDVDVSFLWMETRNIPSYQVENHNVFLQDPPNLKLQYIANLHIRAYFRIYINFSQSTAKINNRIPKISQFVYRKHINGEC